MNKRFQEFRGITLNSRKRCSRWFMEKSDRNRYTLSLWNSNSFPFLRTFFLTKYSWTLIKFQMVYGNARQKQIYNFFVEFKVFLFLNRFCKGLLFKKSKMISLKIKVNSIFGSQHSTIENNDQVHPHFAQLHVIKIFDPNVKKIL